MVRRVVAAVALVVGALVAVPAVGSSAGAQTVVGPTATLSTSPMFVAPGAAFTVTGPALTCPTVGVAAQAGVGGASAVAADQLVISSDVAVAPVAVPQGQPISADLMAVDAVADSYPLTATCLAYGGGSTTVATGWVTITDSAGLPPSSGTATISTGDVTWGESFTVWGDGFAPGSEVQTWMYSDPVLLGTGGSSATGSVVSQVTMPTGAALGSHTIVLAGTGTTGKPLFLTVGLAVGQVAGEQTTTTTTSTTAAPATGAASASGTSGSAAGSVTGTTTSAGTLPVTGGGIGLALPAVGLVSVGSLLALLSRWRERLSTRHV